jgi:hypothetical protein
VARGDALEQAWRLYRREWRHVLAISAYAYGAVLGLSAVFFLTIGPYGLLATAYLWLAALYWLQAPLARLVEDNRSVMGWRGVRATFAAIYPQLGRITGGGALIALIVAALLSTVVLAPLGLYAMTRWALLVPVIAVEDVGLFTAFSRAREIARGHFGELFGRIVLSALLLVLIWIAIGIAAAVVALFDVPLWMSLGGFAVIALTVLVAATPLIALAWTLTYYDLREQVPRTVLRERRLRGGRTLDTAWNAYTARSGRLLLLCLPGALVITVVQVAVEQVHVLLAFPATIALYSALAGIVAAGLDGLDTPSLRQWLGATGRRAAARLPQLLLTVVVLALALTVAIPLVIGLVLLVRWSVAGPVAVVDGAGGVRALRRSAELVRGQARRAAKVVFVSGLVILATLGLFGLMAPADFPLATYVLLALANVLGAPYVGLAWAYMHRALAGLPQPEAAAKVA